jgi:hypothetical protein
MRTVKVYSTSTGLFQLESAATTWEELQADLLSNDIPYQGMKVVESRNNTSLERGDAVLPTGSFVLMLSPEKTKSGGYRETRELIQSIIANYGDEAKNHFNQGRNYTLKSASELDSLLSSWCEIENEMESDDEDNYDADVEAIEMAVKLIRSTSFYDERETDFEIAIDLIYGNKNLNSLRSEICRNVISVSSLSNDEQEWIRKMSQGL